jgi:hypothetical protein
MYVSLEGNDRVDDTMEVSEELHHPHIHYDYGRELLERNSADHVNECELLERTAGYNPQNHVFLH